MRTVIARSIVAVLLIITVVVFAAPAAAQGSTDVQYMPPVDAPVGDPFRPPSTPYGPGNRGIEYATEEGAVVTAAADGSVTFAGVVAGKRWVTIRHADGIRTTYGPLRDIAVAPGDVVARGDVVGSSAGALLLTARLGDAYVDPATLFGTGPPRVHLVPEPLDMPGLEKKSSGFSIPGSDALMSALDWEWRHLAEAPGFVVSLTPAPIIVDSVNALLDWRRQQAHCTEASMSVLERPAAAPRRVAVLVGGLGSSSTNAAVADVDTAALGYDAGDVVRFSYRGGRVPTEQTLTPDLRSVPITDYTPRDTVGDIETSGHELTAVLTQVITALPADAVVDVIAHSQGGLVTRVALADLQSGHPDYVHRLGVVVTLGTPHQGADLATVVRAVAGDALRASALDQVQAFTGLDVGAGDEAVRQLEPGSDFLTELAATPLPDGVRVVSVAARGDVVVPVPRAHLEGAANVVVTVEAISDHDALPGSVAAAREIALAQFGLEPTCRSATDAVMDAAAGDLISNFEHAVAVTHGA